MATFGRFRPLLAGRPAKTPFGRLFSNPARKAQDFITAHPGIVWGQGGKLYRLSFKWGGPSEVIKSRAQDNKYTLARSWLYLQAASQKLLDIDKSPGLAEMVNSNDCKIVHKKLIYL